MGIIFGILFIAAGVFVLSTLAQGLGILLGVISLFTHPVNGKRKRDNE